VTPRRAAARGDRHRVRLTSGRRIARNDRGALSLGYVIVFPAFLAALMLVVQGSVWYLAREAALSAARHGADVARVRGAPAGAGTSAALQFVRSAAAGFLTSPQASAGSSPGTITITVTGKVPAIFPGLQLTVSQSAQAPIEKFTTP
jgi:Flp pilus assembly protein TadG